jgi:uncharacterized protein YggE
MSAPRIPLPRLLLWSFAWGMALGVCDLGASALAQERPTPAVTVVGEASIALAPDLALVRAGVTTQGKTAREASEANNKALAPLMAALKESGIEDRDIETARLSVQPVYEQNRGAAGRIAGFQASNQVTIKLRAIARVADVVDRLIAAGATDFAGVEFRVSTPSPALDEARTQAVADARRKAEIYAKAAGAGVGRALSIEEGLAQGPIPLRSAPTALSTPIAPGEQTLHLAVTVSFELQR